MSEYCWVCANITHRCFIYTVTGWYHVIHIALQWHFFACSTTDNTLNVHCLDGKKNIYIWAIRSSLRIFLFDWAHGLYLTDHDYRRKCYILLSVICAWKISAFQLLKGVMASSNERVNWAITIFDFSDSDLDLGFKAFFFFLGATSIQRYNILKCGQ